MALRAAAPDSTDSDGRAMSQAASWDPPETDGDQDEERRNVTRLLRWLSMFVAWPSLSIALAFLVFTGPADHWLHIFGLLPVGFAALVVFALAPRLAARLVP